MIPPDIHILSNKRRVLALDIGNKQNRPKTPLISTYQAKSPDNHMLAKEKK